MNTYHDIIIFDVDSTLVTIEGLDWLAEQKGVGDSVKKLTQLSMEGAVPMEEVFAKKLSILAPTRKEIATLAAYYCQTLSEDCEEVVATLLSAHKDVWLVTGSFTQAVTPLADKLRIPRQNIHANDIYFDASDRFKGINADCTLTKASGKSRCVQKIGKNKRVAFVGDSVTDLATQPYVTTFVGYGGVAVRKKVRDEAAFFIKSKSLAPLLTLVLD